jgi:hypothetical protein
MTTLPSRRSLLSLVLLTGCHAYTVYDPGPPLPPPPPPPGPPLGAPAPPPTDDPDGSSNTPALPSKAGEDQGDPISGSEKPAPSTTGPLPALPSQAPAYAPTVPAEPPSASEWVRAYPDGQWVYYASHGWIWVPTGAVAAGVDGSPYSYLYTPRFGWTWYVSPWGWGHYHYGSWVTRPAVRHRVWVAHPRVIVRLGRPRRGR